MNSRPSQERRRSSSSIIEPSGRQWLSFRVIVLILLPLLSGAAVHCLFNLGFKNGLFNTIGTLVDGEKPLWPGSEEYLITKYTGIKAIDNQLTTLDIFFAPISDRRSKALNLFALYGLGQFGAGWTLLVLESLRRGNQGRIVSW